MRKNIRYYVYAVVALALLGMCFLLPGSSVFHQGAWLTVILGLLAPVVNRLWAFKAVRRVYWHPLNRAARTVLVAVYGLLVLELFRPWEAPDGFATTAVRLGAPLVYVFLIAPIVTFLPYYPVRYWVLGQLRTPTVAPHSRDFFGVSPRTAVAYLDAPLHKLNAEQGRERAYSYVWCADRAMRTVQNRLTVEAVREPITEETTERVERLQQLVERAYQRCDSMDRHEPGSQAYLQERAQAMANSYVVLTSVGSPAWGMGQWHNPLVDAARGTVLHPHVQALHNSLEQAQAQARETVRALNPVLLHARREGNKQLVGALAGFTRTLEALLTDGLNNTGHMLSLCPNTRPVIAQPALKQMYELYPQALERLVAATNLTRVLSKFHREYEASLEVVAYVKAALAIVPHLHDYVETTGNRFYAKYARHREEALNSVLEARSETGHDALFLANLHEWVNTTGITAPDNLSRRTENNIRRLSAQIAATRTRRALAESVVYAAGGLTELQNIDTARLAHLFSVVNDEPVDADEPTGVPPRVLAEAKALSEKIRSACLKQFPELAEGNRATAEPSMSAFYAAALAGSAYAFDGVYAVREQLLENMRADRAESSELPAVCWYWPHNTRAGDAHGVDIDWDVSGDFGGWENCDMGGSDFSGCDSSGGGDFGGSDGGGGGGGD